MRISIPQSMYQETLLVLNDDLKSQNYLHCKIPEFHFAWMHCSVSTESLLSESVRGYRCGRIYSPTNCIKRLARLQCSKDHHIVCIQYPIGNLGKIFPKSVMLQPSNQAVQNINNMVEISIAKLYFLKKESVNQIS